MRKIHIIMGIALCTLLYSCDALDVKPVSIITTESFWKNSGDAEAYLTGIYNAYRKLNNTSYYGEDRGDAFKAGEIGPVTVAWSQNLLESNAPSFMGAYNIIHHTNLLFSRIEGLKFTNEASKNRIKAQSYFLQAATYFHLLRNWGDVPLITEPVLSDKVELKARSPKNAVMAFILDDIEKAITLFPEDGYVDKNYASRPAAYALKADALMWKAKVLGGGKADLEAAIAAIDRVASSGVELLPDYASVFDNANKKNKEIIFSLYFERYEVGNLSIATNTTSRTDNLSMAANLENAATSPNNSRHVYAPSDKVRAIYLKNPADKRYPVAMIDMVDKDGKLILTQTNKFRGHAYTDDRFFDDDLIVYRWADLLLLRAEANAALGNVDAALKDLNEVRGRAGLADYDGAKNKVAVEKELCDERLRELFIEQKRWYDLLRFHFGGTIDIYNEVPNLQGKTNYPLYLPINYNNMVLNEKLVQTEGYESAVR
ncbi:RagB/SusD family nutrient uptake outer membrane protein [Bacteroides zoogleoformans]|uniref:RagB/SusD family nutrient uptake outer membrane protein n=1 Tax=Bacteroides zoogleoformans TaxID=28119 RepID=UPI00248DAE6A|nr:RagB/SusD family nutrient uptake outer membrane protein [Bacteroides zoogleoformans]